MKLAEICRCLSDETRLRLVHLLAQAPLCVCHLQNILCVDQVTVSKHLAYLRQHGLVVGHRYQQWVIYSLPDRRSPEFELQLRCLNECAAYDKVLRGDRQRFKNVKADCCWVWEVLTQTVTEQPKRQSAVARLSKANRQGVHSK